MSDDLDDAVSDCEAQIVKADSKASSILTFDGLLVAGTSLVSGKNSNVYGTVCAILAGALIVLSASLALMVIRPRLNGGDKRSFVYWRTLESYEEVEASIADALPKAARIHILSGIAFRKMYLLQKAIDSAHGAVVALILMVVTTH